VIANGGTFSGATLSAVSKFCRDIESAGIRDKFYRLNLFTGNNLNAAMVPLYRAESRTAAPRGGTNDTNNNFVSGDFNNTGSLSGLKGDGSTKYINTGLPADFISASTAHLGIGLRATETRAAAFRTGIGTYNGGARSLEIALYATNARTGSGFFTRFATTSDCLGDNIGGATGALGVGNIVAAWPTMYRNGVATGVTATTSENYGSAHSLYVFANNNSNTSVINYTDARINWYSIGFTMTAAQALTFHNAIAAFNTALSRT
jgi:hypothetical protein